jgi:glycosyltransferase involved in cell wall biosynthesis
MMAVVFDTNMRGAADHRSARYRVLIATLRENGTFEIGCALAKQFQSSNFMISTDDENPDIVLYLEYGYNGLTDLLRAINLVRKYPLAKHFLYSESDWAFPILPGAYPSLTKRVDWATGWCYLPRPNPVSQNGDFGPPEPDLLFSFLGRVGTHPLRETIRRLDTASTPCIDIGDAVQRFGHYDYAITYFDLLARSRFVLCPRGFGASSIRIFEAMSVGRVPVVISDEWQPPPGISWADISIVVPEKNVTNIPTLLRELDRKSKDMGEAAKQAFRENYSPEVFFDRLLLSLIQNYSWCNYSPMDTLMRAYHALGWREIWSLGSRAKAQVVDAVLRLVSAGG